ncbi:MAG: bactofilin family protein [Gammaproteobacteria bacterium]
MLKNAKALPPKIVTLIGPDTVITGEIRFHGGLHLDGRLQGNILADSEPSLLVVSRGAIIEGEIHVQEVVIHGEVKGNVFAETRLELGETAQVTGDVHYGAITVSMGATVNGQLIHEPNQRKLLEHRKGPEPS